MKTQISLLIILASLLFSGCASSSPPREVIVFAAASLMDAFTEIGAAFEAQRPGVAVRFSFASSSDLATQLAEGAPADVFASANARQMERVVMAGRIDETPRDFVSNHLVIIVPADNPAGIETLTDLAHPGIRLVLAAPGVPARDFAEQMLANAAADPGYPPDFAAQVLDNLVSEESNVRQAAAKVALGEADAGIVYRSDVTHDLASQAQWIAIPDHLNVTAVYPIAALADTRRPELTRAFIDFVLSQEGQAILKRWGFDARP
jgi:molybdate transport system substrate-binding protein